TTRPSLHNACPPSRVWMTSKAGGNQMSPEGMRKLHLTRLARIGYSLPFRLLTRGRPGYENLPAARIRAAVRLFFLPPPCPPAPPKTDGQLRRPGLLTR